MEDRPPQEAELVARAKGGELDAYEEIVRRHQTIAFRTAWVITRSAADAEEAAQDAFVKAHRALARFRDGSPFRPWLLAIVANEARNRVRGRRPPRGASRCAWPRSAARMTRSRRPRRRSSTPSSATSCSPRSSGCRRRSREAIACRYLLDLSEEETAAALDCPRGTVKSRLSRALERLRLELGEVEV